MEYIVKKKKMHNQMLSANNYYKSNININKKEKMNSTITSKSNFNILKKIKKQKLFIQKKQKEQQLFYSKKNYLYNVLYNKLFFILNFFLISFYISNSKQNSDFDQSPNSKIIITINGPGIKSIFSSDFQYKPDAIFINETKINLEGITDYNNFDMKDGENIIKIYYSNPPDSLRNMFRYNNNIKKIDFSHFDTSKVTDMNNMFANCGELEYINMTGINTSSVTDMGSMFQSCSKLTSLDLSSFNTNSVSNMECMFCSCSKLAYLNISNFNTSSVKAMSHMFSSCSSLESIDISSFSTNKDTDMTRMFYYCIKLKSIKFPTKNKIFGFNMGYLFQECSSLESLDLSSFDTSFTSNINGMFEKCTSLTSINLSNFDTSNIINMDNMFKQCGKLEFLDLSNFDTRSVISMEGMFSECYSLIYLNLKSLIIYNSTNINYIFNSNYLKFKMCCEQEFESILKTKYDFINNCSDICFSESKKIISKLKKCIKDCSADNNEYKYEYNNKCYKKCPNGTISSSDNQLLCIKNCEYHNIDLTECFENLPEGYYVYDKEKKLIDKCHENCKTCNKKGDEDNNNCITCKNGYFFEDGNCVIKCQYNSYIDNNGNKICTCSTNIKCKECSKESLEMDLCISCNNEGGFYPTYYNSFNDEFKNCYNNFTGYYLENNIFYHCFMFCESCSKGGDLDDHNCDECISNYIFLNETDKKGNCYKKCDNYYYFDKSNEYICTIGKECPPSRRLLIKEKRKCIDECYNDDTYKYEYNNKCYKKCPDNKICKYKIGEDILTQAILDNTEYEKNTEGLISQFTQNTESETEEKTYYNIPTIWYTQKTTKELAPQITQNEESQTTKATQYIISAISDSQNIESNWDSGNFFFGLIDKKEINISKDEIINNIKVDIINHKIDYLLSNVTEGNKEDIYIKNEDVLYQITTTDNQNNNIYNNISSIKLGECENILKKIYDIDRNLTLIILKIDYYLEGLLIPIIGYEVYHPENKSKLNLSYCNETLISYNIPVSIDENCLVYLNMIKIVSIIMMNVLLIQQKMELIY